MPSHLAVSDNDQYVILFRLADDGNGFIDNWRKRGWPRELHEWSDFRISGQDLSECIAWPVIREEGKHALILRRHIAKSESRDELVIIKGLKSGSDDGDRSLVGIHFACGTNGMERSACKGIPPIVFIGLTQTTTRVKRSGCGGGGVGVGKEW
jgi:hypothetical protein